MKAIFDDWWWADIYWKRVHQMYMYVLPMWSLLLGKFDQKPCIGCCWNSSRQQLAQLVGGGRVCGWGTWKRTHGRYSRRYGVKADVWLVICLTVRQWLVHIISCKLLAHNYVFSGASKPVNMYWFLYDLCEWLYTVFVFVLHCAPFSMPNGEQL